MSDPLRILQVFGKMNRGGAETMVMNLYRNIDRSKIQFDFVVHTDERCDYDDEIRFLGGKIYRVPRYNGKNHFAYKKVWNDFFKTHTEYKIIHGHVSSTASIYLSIAKKYNLITIAHSHSTSSGTGISSIVKNILQYPIRNIADYLFACSLSAGEWLFGKKAFQKDNFCILHNAIETEKFIFNEDIRAKKRKEFNLENRFIIGHIGRFRAQKNHKALIEIFKKINARNKNSVLMLVGDGELRPSIEKKVKKLRLKNNVIFTGVRSDIAELLQMMDVFVFPSLYEGLPVTLIEAQASGLPCIISDTITEEVKITDLVTFMSLKESYEKWAEQIIKYSHKNKRKNTYDQIVKANYDIKTTSKKLENFYLNLITL